MSVLTGGDVKKRLEVACVRIAFAVSWQWLLLLADDADEVMHVLGTGWVHYAKQGNCDQVNV